MITPEQEAAAWDIIKQAENQNKKSADIKTGPGLSEAIPQFVNEFLSHLRDSEPRAIIGILNYVKRIGIDRLNGYVNGYIDHSAELAKQIDSINSFLKENIVL